MKTSAQLQDRNPDDWYTLVHQLPFAELTEQAISSLTRTITETVEKVNDAAGNTEYQSLYMRQIFSAIEQVFKNPACHKYVPLKRCSS